DEEVPLEETLGAFSRLVDAGKVRAIGASNYTAERLQQALAASKTHGLSRYAKLFRPAGPAAAGSFARGGGRAWRHASAGRPCLADDAARLDGADCKRHQRCPARCIDGRSRFGATARGHRAPGSGRRL